MMRLPDIWDHRVPTDVREKATKPFWAVLFVSLALSGVGASGFTRGMTGTRKMTLRASAAMALNHM